MLSSFGVSAYDWFAVARQRVKRYTVGCLALVLSSLQAHRFQECACVHYEHYVYTFID